MKKEIHKAINWNLPNHQFYDDIYIKQVEQFLATRRNSCK